MNRIILGLFFVLHGLVHLLYFGQSRRIFELQPGLLWPDGGWSFSRVIGDERARGLAAVLLALAAVGFLIAGLGLIFGQAWWQALVLGTAVFSALVFVLFWDGTGQRLDDQGGVGLLINLAILVILLVWPGP